MSRSLKPVITSDEFSENILGFEEVDEEEEEEGYDEAEQNDEGTYDDRGMGVIPEEAGF